MTLVPVGRIDQPHGLEGEVKVVLDAGVEELLSERSHWLLGFNRESVLHVRVERIRSAAGGSSRTIIAKLSCAGTRTEADRFRGASVFLPSHAVVRTALPTDRMKGYRVVDESGNDVGTVDGYLERPSQDLLVMMRPDGREVLIPMVSPIVRKIDAEAGEVTIEIVEGLLDL